MARKIKLDMTGVESYVRCEEGEHVVKVIEAKEGVSQAGNDTIQLKLQVLKGSSKNAVVYDNLTLTETALWRTKQFLDALGMKSQGKLVIDLDRIEGKTCVISVSHEEYQGKKRSKVDEFKKLAKSEPEEDEFDEDELEEEDDFDEDDIDDIDEEEEEEEDDEVDYTKMKLAELKAECKNRGLKVKKGVKKSELIEMLEEDDNPKKKDKKAPTKAKTKKKQEPEEDEDDIDDWDEDDDEWDDED